MPVLIVEFSGKRTRTPLNGRATIGRTPENDIILDHSAVSRTHAVIESIAGSYFITDNKSKNGTVVGDLVIAELHPLNDADRISIGPAMLTFYESEDVPADAGAPALSETHAGVLMDCECGAKLWVPKEMIGGRGQCQKCGRMVALGTAPQTAALIASTLDKAVAPRPQVTKVCSICQWKIEAVDNTHTCSACGLVVHEECWQENRGCSAYGCSQVNVLDKTEEVAEEEVEEIGHPPEIVPRERAFSWEFALLGASVIGSIIGLLLFGMLPLITLIASGAYLFKQRQEARMPVLLLTMIVSLVGLIAGLVVSCMWWLNLHLTTR